MAADVETEVALANVTTETAVVAPILLGMKFYPLKSSLNGPTRPFVGAAVGPFVGSQSRTTSGLFVANVERTEMSIGGQLLGGVDFVLSRKFMLGATVGYNIHKDFKEPICGSVNYGGPVLSIDFSFLFGKGKG